MFSFGRKKTLVKRAAFTGLVLVFLAGLLAGCDNNSGSGTSLHGRLIGVWVDPGFADEYTIDRTTLSYTCSSPGGAFCMCFSSPIRRVIGLEGEAASQLVSGVIIFQYAAGDYRALYFSGDAAGDSLRLSTAWDNEAENGEHGAAASQPNLNAAITRFRTTEAMQAYISFWGGPYERQ